MIVTTATATKFLIKTMAAKLVPMLGGSPGIGKSAIIYDIAKQYNLHVIDIRLSQCDPTDINGFPTFQNSVASYIPMNIFPIEAKGEKFLKTKNKDKIPNPNYRPATPIPSNCNGFLLFLDEFNSATQAVQAASYKLVLDRMVGQYKLHEKTAIICAGNLNTDNAIINRLSTAMQTRLIHMELIVDVELWLDWASHNKIDHRIMAYIHNRPDNLYNFDPDHNDKTFACPRTWEFLSKLIKDIPDKLMDWLPLIAGTISESIAHEFVIYTETYIQLPTYIEILNNPTTARLNTDPGLLYAVAYLITARAKKDHIDALIKYINRMPIEFETITLQNIIRRIPEIIQEKVIQDWIAIKGADLLS